MQKMLHYKICIIFFTVQYLMQGSIGCILMKVMRGVLHAQDVQENNILGLRKIFLY